MRRVWRLWRDAYGGLPPALWRLAVVCFLNRVGTMVLPFLSLYLTQDQGLSSAEAGAMLGAWGFGSMAGAALGGWVSDLRGPRFTLLLSLFSSAVAFIILGQLPVPWIPAGLFATALLADMFRPAAMSSLPRLVPTDEMPRAVGLIRATVNLGQAIGPATGGLLAMADYELLFWVDGLSCGVAGVYVLWALFLPAAPAVEERNEGHGRDTGRLPAFFALLVVYMLCFCQFIFTVPVFMAEAHGASEALVGLVFALNTVLIVGVEMLLVRRTQGWTPLRAMALGAALVGAGYLVLPLGGAWGGPGVWVVFLGTAVWTLGEMLCDPMIPTFISRNTAPRQQGRAMSLLAVTFGLGFTVGPALGLFAYGVLGPLAYFWSVGGLGIAAGLGWWALARGGPRSPAPAPAPA